MKTQPIQLTLLLSCVAVVYCGVQCRTDYDCRPEECCAFVIGKYGSTSCERRGGLEDSCRPGASPINTTVSEPGSTPVEVTGVHYMVCPCTRGLNCDYRGSCVYSLPDNSESHPAQIPRQ